MTQFMDDLMAEKINYGGMVATRADAYFHALACISSRPDCPSPEAARLGAEMFAFGTRARTLTPDEVALRESQGLVMDPATGEPKGV